MQFSCLEALSYLPIINALIEYANIYINDLLLLHDLKLNHPNYRSYAKRRN